MAGDGIGLGKECTGVILLVILNSLFMHGPWFGAKIGDQKSGNYERTGAECGGAPK